MKLPLRGLPPDRDRIIVVGVSTGGVQAITRLLAGFPGDAPGIVVVQHMPAGFTAALAERLDRDPTIPLEVAEARHGDARPRGRALIVPGGDLHGVVRRDRPRPTASSWSRGPPSAGSDRASTSCSARRPRPPATAPSA